MTALLLFLLLLALPLAQPIATVAAAPAAPANPPSAGHHDLQAKAYYPYSGPIPGPDVPDPGNEGDGSGDDQDSSSSDDTSNPTTPTDSDGDNDSNNAADTPAGPLHPHQPHRHAAPTQIVPFPQALYDTPGHAVASGLFVGVAATGALWIALVAVWFYLVCIAWACRGGWRWLVTWTATGG